jgi:hypothetical protein
MLASVPSDRVFGQMPCLDCVNKDIRIGLQHAVLKILQCTVATVPPEGGYKHPQQPAFHSTRPTFCSSEAGP